MKILIGAHGVGKTTLLKQVQTSFPDYYVTDGFSRPVAKIAKDLDFSAVEQQHTINELSAWAYQNYLTHNKVISTRSIIDCIIYSEILRPELDIENLITLFERTKHEVEYFFYIPVEFEYIVEEGRPGGMWQELQVKIDEVLRDFINVHIPAEKVITLTGSVQDRLNQIQQYL